MRGVKVLLGAILVVLAVIAWALLRPRPADRLAARVEEAIDRGPALRWYSGARSDLKNLWVAQAVYHEEANRYARTLDEMKASWTPFADATFTLDGGKSWWTATATDFGRSFSCVMYHGAVPSGPPKTVAGRPAPEPDVVFCDDWG